MSEAQIGFLYNIAAVLSQSSEDNQTKTLLKSYYLMRCKEVTGEQKLPDKHFSSKIRCQKCFIEWKKNTKVMVRSKKLSKKQRRRIRSNESSQKHEELLNSNEIVQVCTFCNNSTIITALKPKKEKPITRTNTNYGISITKENIKEVVQRKLESKTTNVDLKKKSENKLVKKPAINVYSNAFDVFSMKNKDNILASSVKEQPKVIKNNKRKKDKFAGLCQKAVLASAKIKEDKVKQNKLNLFLKPSSNV